MNTIAEIESAIERLPAPQVAELAAWLEQFRERRAMQILVNPIIYAELAPAAP